ncbi:cytoplasmic polyadenylation element-binding protein 1-like [Paramacrobiotus metropolitanus]|uniref:cytoplasmic polyadenylation element-binding protein 1-like n=1 Tax=Paramacrobiotus metropolitanus TaxID=2943436 RepID=UPI0024464907|nr:cytoplasmic polyadenylation element-binding protein 1-like [Paramacrobiotus metropolitanus]
MAQKANSFFKGLEDSFRDLSFDSPSSIASRSLLASSPPQHSLEFGTWANPSPSPTLERGVPVLPPPLTPLGRYNRGIPNSSRAARMAILRDSGNSHVVWSGTLPPRNCRTNSPFSCKVFLGGVPWDITETDLQKTFGVFGPLRVEWPGVHDHSSTQRPKGHLYLLFEDERSVMKLLGRCSYDGHHNQHNWFYRVASRRMLGKSAQVIPWQLADATYALHGYVPTPGTPYRIFVANLHGMITAEGLGRIMNDLFGGVIAATLDTDKTKYPIGSGRVTFNNPTSHLKAITAETVEIRTAKFTRQIKIDPYLEDAMCSTCGLQPGPYFCRDLHCFDYFCSGCWQAHHALLPVAPGQPVHLPLVRPARQPTQEHF